MDKLNFLDSAEGKNLPASVGDTGLIPDPGRFHITQNN